MGRMGKRFSGWWQAPRKARESIGKERRVSFLELFYDLVYVVLISAVAHSLAAHLSFDAFVNYIFLFVLIWWAWFNGSSYHDLHSNDDVRTRVFTFIQMGAVVAMTFFAHDAMGEGSVGFALSYAAFMLILTFLWWRTGAEDEDHRLISRPYSAVFLVCTILYAVSAFSNPTLRIWLWAAALVLGMGVGVYAMLYNRIRPNRQSEFIRDYAITPSFAERCGLFVIIAIGEVLVGVLGGLGEAHEVSGFAIFAAIIGMLLAIGIWWNYFDWISLREVRRGILPSILWTMLHLPLMIGISAMGAAVLNIIEHGSAAHLPDNAKWLLVGSVAAVLIITGLLSMMLTESKRYPRVHYRARYVMPLCGLAAILLGVLPLSTALLLSLITLCLFGPVLYVAVAVVLLESETETGNDNA